MPWTNNTVVAEWDLERPDWVAKFFRDLASEIEDGDWDQHLEVLADAVINRRLALRTSGKGAPARRQPTKTSTTPAGVAGVGSHVRINSPRNYSWHGLEGVVTHITNGRRSGETFHINLDKPRFNRNGRSSSKVRVPAALLEVIK